MICFIVTLFCGETSNNIMKKDNILVIEEKIAYLELANSQLEDEVYRQKLQIDALTASLKTVKAFMEVLDDRVPNEKLSVLDSPPHY